MTYPLRALNPSRPPALPAGALLLSRCCDDIVRLAISVTGAGILVAALLACSSVAAQAQIRVDGPADAVRIDVVNAPLHDVLGALQTRFGLRYRSNVALDTVRTAKFHAPLSRVIARLLEGYDFVSTVTPEGIDVLILPQSEAANIVIPSIVSARAPAPAAPVMTSGETSRYPRD